MPQQMIWFFVSIAFSFVAWGMLIARYIWPRLRLQERVEALRPLLILHSFRFVGLAKDEDEERRHNREEEEDDEEEEETVLDKSSASMPVSGVNASRREVRS